MSAIRGAVRWEGLATAALLGGAAILMLSRVPAIEAGSRDAFCRADSDYHIEPGEALLHGVRAAGHARAMPSYSVPNAFLCNHLPVRAAAAVRLAVVLACAVLVFALGSLLYSGLCGAAAVFLYSIPPPASESGERWLYVLAVLLTAYYLVRRAKRPSPRASAAVGAAVGTSLLMLPSLCLFPFLLALHAWTKDRRVRDAAALCAVPFLFLIPWIAMNWRLGGGFVLFEDGRVHDNIITGALGFVRAMGIGDSRAMAGLAADQSAFSWAIGEIWSHPLRYLSAVWGRSAFAASLHPLLVLGAAGSLWLSRAREDCRQLALLAAYYFGMHFLMPVQENYFVPAWPILAVLASGLLSAWTRPSSGRLKELSAAAAGGLFALLLVVQAGVLGLAWSYPDRASAPGGLERELAKHPRDPWLWSERGMHLLREGRAAQAVGPLARALSLDPRPDREHLHAWALLARGGPAAKAWERRGPGSSFFLGDLRERALRFIYLGLDGRLKEADGVLPELVPGSSLPRVVIDIISSWPAATRPSVIALFSGRPGFEFAGENELAEIWLNLAAAKKHPEETLAFAEGMNLDAARSRKLAASYRDLGEYARALRIFRRVKLTGAADADLLLSLADAAAKSGQPAAALETLAFAESLELGPDSLRKLALAYRDHGAFTRALAVLKRADRLGPEDADLLLGLAAGATAGGQRSAALDLLAFAERLSLSPDRTRKLALAYWDVGGSSRSLAVLRRADLGPNDVSMLLTLAAREASAGRRPAALETLALASGSRHDPESIRKVALGYRDAGLYSRALDVLKRAELAGPKDAGMLLDIAVRAGRDGRRTEALASLAFAERLELGPDGLRGLAAAYRALGGYHASLRIRRRMGDDAGAELDRAESAAAAGDGRRALAHAARVRDPDLVDEEARRLALIYQGQREYARALEVVARRLVARPHDARWRNDRGSLLALMGRREEAAADWASAIAHDPDFLAPYLSLGTLYTAASRRTEALDLYQRALSRRQSRENAGVLRRILSERRKLLRISKEPTS